MYLVKRFTQLNLWNKLNVLGVIVTVFSAGFSILVFMSATENVMQPRYAVDWHESLFTQRDDLPDLRINWRGKEYTNLFVAHVALWNQGGKAIDKSSISTTNPPRILCPAFVSVLSAELVKTSRQSLKMALREIFEMPPERNWRQHLAAACPLMPRKKLPRNPKLLVSAHSRTLIRTSTQSAQPAPGFTSSTTSAKGLSTSAKD